MFTVTPVRALADNYIWVLQQNRRAIIVDPGQAAPAQAFLEANQLTLEAILLTHHHADHTGGVSELSRRWPEAKVYGPADIALVQEVVMDGSHIDTTLGSIAVLGVPGHTLDHLAYRLDDHLFCGDTLFGAGCGRLFEGTAAQMYQSLNTLAQLADNTLVYPAHEYTLSNLAFALAVEPDNAALQQREVSDRARRAQGEPTLPSTVATEKATNPFLRATHASIQKAVQQHTGSPVSTPELVFAELREWKNHFR
ncbi:MAG TPA: hydroxyacylglutathione hydrolase [Chromobacteriaceae bacterium]|nr:hydroxyacylglutathione hydrolase [Chromobacteriaceae bacterium]